MANAVNWFEIPASNFARAVQFYSAVFSAEMHSQNINGIEMAFFPADQGAVGGAVCHGEMYTPSADGSIVYLNGGDEMDARIGRIEENGGKVVMPKTKVNEEVGYIAMFMDTEGNRVAFHSYK